SPQDCAGSATPAQPASTRMLHRRPKAVLVKPGNVELGTLAGATRDDGAAAVMHVQHELLSLRAWVSKQLLEHERHVTHQVDGIVPHYDEPRPVDGEVLRVRGLVRLDRRGDRSRGHGLAPTRSGTLTAK